MTSKQELKPCPLMKTELKGMPGWGFEPSKAMPTVVRIYHPVEDDTEVGVFICGYGQKFTNDHNAAIEAAERRGFEKAKEMVERECANDKL